MFYRVAKAYYKWDGKNTITAYFITSLFLNTIICCPILLLINKDYLIKYDHKIKIFLIAFELITLTFISIRYWESYEKLREKFKIETEFKRKIKGTIVVLALIFPIAIFIFVSIMRK